MRTIDADALKEQFREGAYTVNGIREEIDNASTVEPKLSDEQIEKITDLLETEWGYEGIREDVSRILRGGREGRRE